MPWAFYIINEYTMNENLAKQILKIFANNPFDAYNHKQVSSRIGAGS